MTGNLLGTPQYMSPEQCKGEELTEASNVYALGITLYEMITGQAPFEADTPLAIVHKQIANPLPSPRTYRPDIPESIEKILFKALAKEPSDRFPNVDSFITEISQNEGQITSDMTLAVSPLVSDETLMESTIPPEKQTTQQDNFTVQESFGQTNPTRDISRYLIPLVILTLFILVIACSISIYF
jgi:serine/threonine protein kinase